MHVEDIRFQKSTAIERLLIDWGYALCAAVKSANNVDDLAAIRSVVTEFSVLASTYSESIEGFQEDLGVSLGEAVDFKRDAIARRTGSNEWGQYLIDTEESLKILSNMI